MSTNLKEFCAEHGFNTPIIVSLDPCSELEAVGFSFSFPPQEVVSRYYLALSYDLIVAVHQSYCDVFCKVDKRWRYATASSTQICSPIFERILNFIAEGNFGDVERSICLDYEPFQYVRDCFDSIQKMYAQIVRSVL